MGMALPAAGRRKRIPFTLEILQNTMHRASRPAVQQVLSFGSTS